MLMWERQRSNCVETPANQPVTLAHRLGGLSVEANRRSRMCFVVCDVVGFFCLFLFPPPTL